MAPSLVLGLIMADTNPLASELARIRQNHADSEAARGLHDLSDRADAFYSSVMDVPVLLAAVEAVLAQAGDWETSRAERPVTRAYAARCFRAAIVRALTKGEAPGGE